MQFTYKIYYEDTDAQGIVYYGNYLKFFERARTDLLEQLGIDQLQLIREENTFFVIRKCEIEYFSSVTLGNIVDIEITVSKIGNSSLQITENMYHHAVLVTSFVCTVVFVQKETNGVLKPRKIPEEMRQKFTTVYSQQE